MDWLKNIAPALATAMGGPLAGAAATFIAERLGASDKTVEAVKEIVSGNSLTPEQISSLKQAEIDFQKFLEANKIRLEEIHAADRADARKMQASTGSRIPGALAVMITLGFFGLLSGMLAGELKVADSQALLVMLGALGAAFGSVIQFYFGSSHGSQQKNTLLAGKQ